MIIKECYVSKNGISCFTNINTMHNIKKINYNNYFLANAKNGFLFYITLRFTEFILRDFIENKDLLFKNIDDDYFLTCVMFD